jgi:predicted transcriptional regulator
MAPGTRKRADRRYISAATRKDVVRALQLHHSYKSIEHEQQDRTERQFMRELQSGGMTSLIQMQLVDAYGVAVKRTT